MSLQTTSPGIAGRCRLLIRSCALACVLLGTLPRAGDIYADTLTVAVASNFAETLQLLAAEFERVSGHRVVLVRGSSGRHFAQIINGAPFDVFLSADAERPGRLLEQMRLPTERRHSYALGQLVVWGRGIGSAAATQTKLESGDYGSLAIANPRLAPYGLAATETLQALGLGNVLQNRAGKVIRGENVAQTYQYVATGNAELGFVALSQVLATGQQAYWQVPAELYQPIDQQLVVLNESDASLALLNFLKSRLAREIIRQAGYGLPDP